MPAHNERFGATAAGRAALKGSAGKPPLRQAAIPLAVTRENAVPKGSVEKVTENGVTVRQDTREAIRAGN